MIRSRFHALLGIAALAMIGATASASDRHGSAYYEVTITNLTRGQVFSPPLIATHPQHIALFETGAEASEELAMLAQNGAAGDLAAALGVQRGVHVTVADGPVMPGHSLTLYIAARSPHSRLSMASMLVSTNDAFAGLNGIPLPRSPHHTRVRTAIAYDAGAEANDENCDNIPGPPCGDMEPSGDAGEGYVHVHAGIHGIGNLEPSQLDWRNPVAKVSVRRIVRR